VDLRAGGSVNPRGRGLMSTTPRTKTSRASSGAANTGAEDVVTNHPTTVTSVEADARRLTTRIQLVFGSMLDQHDKLVELVGEAKATSAHVALGYPSWPAYVSAEFGELQSRLGVDDRRVLVGALTATGLPTRTIAEVAGVDHSTVVRDQKQVVHPAPPAERTVTGRDGKSYMAVQPERKPPRRSPLPDSYRSAMRELRKSIERLARLHADDRFLANRNALHNLHWRQLSNVQALLGALDMDLGGHNQCSDCDERMFPTCQGELRPAVHSKPAL